MIQYGKLPMAGLGIVAGGLLLGAALAGYANPSPKQPPAPPWAGQIEPPIAAEAPITYNSYPEDLHPGPSLVDGYAPAVASTELRTPADPPFPRLDSGSEQRWERQWNERWADSQPSRAADIPSADQPTTAERTVPHYAAFERAEAARPARAETPQDADAPVDAETDPASLRTNVDLASPPPLPAAGRPKIVHIASADSDK